MLAKINRLQKQQDVVFALRKGMELKGPLFRIRAAKKSSSAPRIAVVIGAKESKGAVQRNRIRRRTREAARRIIGSFKNHDVVIFPSRNVAKAAFPNLVDELTRHAKNIQTRQTRY